MHTCLNVLGYTFIETYSVINIERFYAYSHIRTVSDPNTISNYVNNVNVNGHIDASTVGVRYVIE